MDWVRVGVMALTAMASIAARQCAIAAPTDAAALSADSPIIFAVSNDNSLPLVEFRQNALSGGILKDLGDAIAMQLHRKAKYVVTPRKRLDETLATGSVDGVCYDRPEWVTVPLNWSQAVIPNEILLVTGPGIAKPKKLDDVAGKTIGLVLGYQYPELKPLGNHFQREDAPNMFLNIQKLIAGRVQYAVIDRLSLQYQAKSDPQIASFASLSITKIQAACGFSLASKVPFDDINRTIRKLVDDGAMDRILAQYR